MDTMTALRAHTRGGTEQLVVESAPVPRPGQGEALVAVHAAAITFTELRWDETWTNRDGTAHSVKSDDGSFVSQDLDPGQTFTATFKTPGTFAYVCGIHSSMTGTVVVQG